MQAATTASLRVELLTLNHDWTACQRLVAQVFGQSEAAVADWFQKRLIQNPWQKDLQGFGAVAYDGERLIGFRGMFAQRWSILGEERTIAWTANTCMPEGYRGKGLGTALIKKSQDCNAWCATSSSGLGTQPIYRKLGYRAIGNDNDHQRLRISLRPSLARRLGTGIAKVLGPICDRRLLPSLPIQAGWQLMQCTQAGAEFDHLWQEAQSGYAALQVRDAAALNHRLFVAATQPLKLSGIRDPQGRLRAYAIWHVQLFPEGIRWVVLRDWFAAIDDPTARRELLARLLLFWREQGHAEVSIEVAHPTLTAEFQALGCTPVPSQGVRYQVLVPESAGLSDAVFQGWLRAAVDGDYLDLAAPDIT